VSDVLDLFAAGLSAGEILEEMPDLEADDLKASLEVFRATLRDLLLGWYHFGMRATAI
jgi:uncharacterized protein (DUF433 family)